VRLWDARSRKSVTTVATKGTKLSLFGRKVVGCYLLAVDAAAEVNDDDD